MDVATALGTYLEIVDSCAPGLVEGLYVVGSFALDDWHEGTSDIDIVAVTAEPATDEDAGALLTAHAVLAEQQPSPFIDGPYVAWGDLITPPMALHRPWTLDGQFHHDAECFELNPVTWYVLATYGVTVRGPTVDRLGVYVDVEARTHFVVDNLRSYWRPLADRDPQRLRRRARPRLRRVAARVVRRSARCACTSPRSPARWCRSALPASTACGSHRPTRTTCCRPPSRSASRPTTRRRR